MDCTTIKMDNWGGWPIGTTFAKNTFIAEFDPIILQGMDELTVFAENQIVQKENLGELLLTDYFHMAFDTTQNLSSELKTFFEFIQSK